MKMETEDISEEITEIFVTELALEFIRDHHQRQNEDMSETDDKIREWIVENKKDNNPVNIAIMYLLRDFIEEIKEKENGKVQN